MKNTIFILFFLLISFTLVAEEEAGFSKTDIETYQSQATELVNFLEFTLNTVGSTSASQKEKEIIINESFLKIFANEKVQVEDDLDENRTVPTNKDIQAYLKDIDFFFREVAFKFTVEEVSHHVSDSNYLFFKFQINRNLRAKYFSGDTINTNKTRFIEINFDDENQDLKIASIYTTKLNEKEEFRNWWNTMPQIWKDFFGQGKILNDSTKLARVNEFTDSTYITVTDTTLIVEIDTFLAFNEFDTLFINEIDTVNSRINDTILFDAVPMYTYIDNFFATKELIIPDTLGIVDLSPLSKLTELRSLTLAGNPVESLIPIRNLIKLEELNIQKTNVKTLTALRYSTNLKQLDFSHTLIWDLSPVSKFLLLEQLYFNRTPIEDIQPISRLEFLNDLRFKRSNVHNIDSLQNLKSLGILNLGSTNVRTLEPLSGLENLRILMMDSTHIADLSPLESNAQLSKIYCDYSSIKAEEANRFMSAKPDCQVIFESEELGSWWAELSNAWKETFRKYKELDENPSSEQLHEIPKIKIINIGGNEAISSLEPLQKLIALEHLSCQNTSIDKLDPLKDLFDLKYLDARGTKIRNLFPILKLHKIENLYLSNTNVSEIMYLEELNNLRELDIENTAVRTLEPVSLLQNLNRIYADNTAIDLIEVRKFRKRNAECLLLFRTSELQKWWSGLDGQWRQIFVDAAQISNEPVTDEDLHRMSMVEIINLANMQQLGPLNPLTKLSWLKELNLSGTRINSLRALSKIKTLEKLECADNPIGDLSDIMRLPKLSYLDISNIPIRDFEQIQNMRKLEKLICPGTQIKNLKYLDNLKNLKHLEIYNTKVKNINQLDALNLESLKCYNTGIHPKKIQAFKASNRNCEVTFY